MMICFLLGSYISLAQENCQLQLIGTFIDATDNTPIADVAVYIASINQYATSNIDGTIKLQKLCKGNLNIKITHLGYEKQHLNIDLKNTIERKRFKLIPKTTDIEDIHVKSTHQLKHQTHLNNTLKTDQIEQMSNGNLGDVVKTVEGVNSINTGNSISKPIIGGLHSNRVLISFNDTRLEDQQWGIEHAPNIDMSTVNKITVVKGASALEYGSDAIGGLLILEPHQSVKKDTIYGKTLLSQQSNGRLFAMSSRIDYNRKKGFFFDTNISFKKGGDFETPKAMLNNTGLESKGVSLHTGIKKNTWGISGFYSYLNSNIGILRGAHIGNNTDLVEVINGTRKLIQRDFSFDIRPPKQTITHQLFNLKSYKKLDDWGKLSLKYDLQINRRKEFDLRRGKYKNKPSNNLLLTTQGIDVKLNLKGAVPLDFGISLKHQKNIPNIDTGIRRLIPDYTKYEIGGYGIFKYQSEKILLSGGIRYDYQQLNAFKYYLKTRWKERGYDQHFSKNIKKILATQILTKLNLHYHNTALTLGFHYDLTKHQNITLNYSLSSRAPNLSELFSDGLHHGAARIELGDLAIKAEKAQQFQLGYQFHHQQLQVNIGAYYNHINDFIYSSPTGINLTLRGSFMVWSYQQTNARIVGVNSNINYWIHPLLLLTNKSAFLRGDDLSHDTALIDMPPFNTKTTLKFQLPHWHDFYIALESDYNARQDHFPDNNFKITLPRTGKETIVDTSTPPDGYHLFHLALGGTFTLGKTTIKAYLFIDNIGNERYRNYLNRLRYYADELGRNFRFQFTFNY